MYTHCNVMSQQYHITSRDMTLDLDSVSPLPRPGACVLSLSFAVTLIFVADS